MTWQAVSPDALVERLTDRIDELVASSPGAVRVAVDGPPSAAPGTLATDLVDRLRGLGRVALHVPAEGFWRDRSVRLEYGREDVESYAQWLDHRALRREVLDRVASTGSCVPSLRDPVSDRSTRADPVDVGSDGVVVVSGALLFGLGLPFELTVHLATSPAARRRRTPEDQQWTLPAFDDYDRDVDPQELADVAVRVDDPRHPAVSWA